jgi:predicted transposase YbfD/YdcC
MTQKTTSNIFTHFEKVKDPRLNRKKKHNLSDMFFMTLLAVICGADNWVMIREFCKSKEIWLTKLLGLEHGIPSHDTFGRVFAMIDTKAFSECFTNWMKDISELTKNEIIAIDGKCLRGVKNGLTIVNAWACTNQCVLAQEVVDSKSNEITAIPKVLEKLDLSGTIVTMDAMGTQRKIAQQIIEQKADYLLALKGNQSSLHDDVALWFKSNTGKLSNRFDNVDCDHGRIENRSVIATSDIDWLKDRHDWVGLKTIVAITSTREIKSSGDISQETRYFISSIDANNIERIADAIRSHWSIENKLHWSLDVSFSEDSNRTRVGNGAENLSIVRHTALNILKEDKSQMGIKTKRMKAGWDEKFMLKLIGQF